MASLPVIPRLDVPKNRASSIRSRMPIVLHQQLELERRKKAFGHGVVVTVTLAAHARNHAVRRQVAATPEDSASVNNNELPADVQDRPRRGAVAGAVLQEVYAGQMVGARARESQRGVVT
jgi:hypothetical protein